MSSEAKNLLRKQVWYEMTDLEIEYGCSVLAREAEKAIDQALARVVELTAVLRERLTMAEDCELPSGTACDKIAALITTTLDKPIASLNIKPAAPSGEE